MRKAAKRLLFLFLRSERVPSLSSRAPSGKVGNRFLVFHFSRRARLGGGNVKIPAGFSRGDGKRGKPVFGFPRFPRSRHFHGPSAPSTERRRNRRLHFALPQ